MREGGTRAAEAEPAGRNARNAVPRATAAPTRVEAGPGDPNRPQTGGNPNLQYLLVPARLEQTLAVLDTDSDGEIDACEWENAIELALRNKLEMRAAQREAAAAANRKEIEEFTEAFLNAARECFQMIDKDNSGTLTKDEIVKAIKEDKKVVSFLRTCGEPNLQFLLQPARLKKALDVLDTSKDGEIDIDEWEEAIYRGLAKRIEDLKDEQERRARAAAAADAEFSAEFLSMARMARPRRPPLRGAIRPGRRAERGRGALATHRRRRLSQPPERAPIPRASATRAPASGLRHDRRGPERRAGQAGDRDGRPERQEGPQAGVRRTARRQEGAVAAHRRRRSSTS